MTQQMQHSEKHREPEMVNMTATPRDLAAITAEVVTVDTMLLADEPERFLQHVLAASPEIRGVSIGRQSETVEGG